MTKYRRKPTVVEAYHWTGNYDEKTTPRWLMQAMKKKGDDLGAARIVNNEIIKMVTESGILTAYKNDYVLKGPKGELYPCKYDVFHMLHEEVDE